jgi:hypothetical protein
MRALRVNPGTGLVFPNVIFGASGLGGFGAQVAYTDSNGNTSNLMFTNPWPIELSNPAPPLPPFDVPCPFVLNESGAQNASITILGTVARGDGFCGYSNGALNLFMDYALI